MKPLIIAIIIAIMLMPALATAQETTEMPTIPEQVSWSVTPARAIIFIGEDLIVNINGTGNTSFVFEMRPLDDNNTVMNATFTDYQITDVNGTKWIVVPDGFNENAGNYRVQVLINQMVVAYADVRLDYSFERWVAIQIEDGELMDIWQNDTAQEGFERDNLIVKRLLEAEKLNKLMFALVIFMFVLSIPAWLDIYRRHCETKAIHSRFLDALSGVEEDRAMYYGGVTIGKDPPRMYGGSNSCAGKKDNNHDSDVCPHCQLDYYADKLGFSGMTHQQIVREVGGGKKVKKVVVPKSNYIARKIIGIKYKSSHKPKKDKKVKP